MVINRFARRFLPISLVLALNSIGCSESDSPSGSNEPDRIVEGVNVTRLFAAPTEAEMGAMRSEWSTRDVDAVAIEEIRTANILLGSAPATVTIFAHDVSGARHVGAVMTPADAAPGSLPVLIFLHGGDNGMNLDDAVASLPLILGDLVDDFVYVAPAFRSEPLTFAGSRYVAGGAPSPWDWDAEDARALLTVALERTPQADPERIGIVGASRGAAVALLMGIRDPRIDMVAEFAGPTDFFGPFVQGAVESALRGQAPSLPGVDYLDGAFIQPLKRGEIGIEEVRRELLRRSSVYFAADLPDLQVHHGTADMVVPVGEGERLIAVMRGLGRTTPGFEGFIYPGAGHETLYNLEAILRLRVFLRRLVTSAGSAPR